MKNQELTPAAEQHIQDNHQFETIGRMAGALNAPEYLIRAFLIKKGLTVTRFCRKRVPDQSAGELFDINKYALENFAV